MRYLSTQRKKIMPNILAAIIVTVAYIAWGLWNISRQWKHTDDLDAAFFWSLLPLAIATWYALRLAGA
jgi:hypothetical protein